MVEEREIIHIDVDDEKVRAALGDMANFLVAGMVSLAAGLHRQDLLRFESWPAAWRSIAQQNGAPEGLLSQMCLMMAQQVERVVPTPPEPQQPEDPKRPGHLRVV